jgi:hypothetical protein
MKKYRIISNDIDDDITHNYRSKNEKQILKAKKAKRKLQKRRTKFLDDLEDDL